MVLPPGGVSVRAISQVPMGKAKATQAAAAARATAAAPYDEDEDDYAPPDDMTAADSDISVGTLNQLTRNFNGASTLRFADLFLLAVDGEKDPGSWLPRPATNPISAPTLTISNDKDEIDSFASIPGRDKTDDSGGPAEENEDASLTLPPWDPEHIGFSLVVPKPKPKTLLDRFEMDPSQIEVHMAQKTASTQSNAFSSGSAMSIDDPSSSSHQSKQGDMRHATSMSTTPQSPVGAEDSGYDSATTNDVDFVLPDIETLVHPVQTIPWEHDIIWDDYGGDADEIKAPAYIHASVPISSATAFSNAGNMDTDDGNTADTSDTDSVGSASTQETNKSSSGRVFGGGMDDDTSSIFGDAPYHASKLSESIFRPPKALSLPSTVKLISFSGPESNGGASEGQLPSAQTSIPPEGPPRTQDLILLPKPLSWSSFPAYNRRLDEDDWLERVVWDDSDLAQVRRLAPPSAKVEVDMTDVHILLEEEGAHLESDDNREDNADAANSQAKKVIRKRHLQLKTKTTDLSRSKLDALHSVDKFNLSRDAYYMGGAQARAREKKSIKLQHSTYALNNVLMRRSLTELQYKHFHRPLAHMFTQQMHTISNCVPLNTKKKRSRGLDAMKHRSDLSAREGRIVLFEYTEEFPPALSDIGMASRIITYHRQEARVFHEEAPELAFLNAHEKEVDIRNLVTDHMPIEDGEYFYLDKSTDMPFLGDIQKGATMQAVHNNLFRAPIFRHPSEPSDFLLIRSVPTGEMTNLSRPRAHASFPEDQQLRLKSFFVRDIPAVYLVGQQEPEQAIPAPSSRAENEYVRLRLEQFSHFLFSMSKAQNGRAELKLSQILSYFQRTDTAARKVLRRFAHFDRAGEGTWSFSPDKERATLPTDSEIRAMTTLDDACLFDCQQAVSFRLKALGIWPIQVETNNIHRNVKTLYERGDPRFRISRFIAEELELAAWSLTSNFIESMRSKSILQLTGLGDPSGCGQAYSYLRLPMKVAGLKKDKEREAAVHVKGTGADLRQLTLPELNSLLLDAGVSEEDIATKQRWDKVRMLNQIADSRKKQESEDSNISKFARISKHSVATHQDQYNSRIQQIWSNQITALRYNPNADQEEEEAADLSSMLGVEMDLDSEGDAAVAGKGAEISDEEQTEKKETESYLKFVNSLEATKPGESSAGDQSAAPTRPGSPSGAGSTTVTKVLDDVIALDPSTGRPTKPGTYAKIVSTSSNGIETVTWSQDAAKLALARETSGALKQSNKKAKATRAKRAANPDAKPIKCGRCGQTGHNRNSSACPKYDEDSGKRKTNAGGARKKKGKKQEESEDEEEIVEDDWIEEEEDDGEETPEEDFADDVGIAANRARGPVVMTEGTKLRINVSNPRRRAATKRKRGDFVGFDEDEDDDEEFGFGGDSAPRKRAPPKPRVKADSPQGELNTLLRSSLDAVYTLPLYEVFKSRVDKQLLPDYYIVIKVPMHMDLIASRLRSYSYTSVEKYLADWDLLRRNCHTYNHITSPSLLPLADELYRTVASTVESIGTDRLQLLEEAVRASLAADGGTPSTSVPVTPAPNSHMSPRMQVDHDYELDIM